MFEMMMNSNPTIPFVPTGTMAVYPTGGSVPSSGAYGAMIAAGSTLYYQGGINAAGQYANGLRSIGINASGSDWQLMYSSVSGARYKNCLFQNNNWVETVFGAASGNSNSALAFRKDGVQSGGLSAGATPRQEATCVGYSASSGNLSREAYFFGGLSSQGVLLNDVFTMAAWTNGSEVFFNPSNPPPARRSHAAAIHANNLMFILGGIGAANPNTPMSDLWVYNINANTWARKADFPLPIMNTAMVAYNGYLYVWGGGLSTDTSKNTNRMFRYEIATDKWVEVNTPGFSARRGHCGALVGSKLYFVGGQQADGSVLSQTLVYTP